MFDLARRVDRHPEVYRWSYRRDLGDCRLVVVDSRAARVLEPDRRSMLDPDEMAWLDEQLTGDVEHLFIGTSLPFLLPPGLHDFEAIDEVLAEGAHGRLVATGCRAGPPEHRPRALGGLQRGLRRGLRHRHGRRAGHRGAAPSTIVFLSGDVHNSYVAEVTDAAGGTAPGRASSRPSARRSATRCPRIRVMMSAFARESRAADATSSRPARKRVPDPAYPWLVTDGPWFDNCLAEATIQGPDLAIVWRGGEVRDGDDLHPVLTTVVRSASPAASTSASVSARALLTNATPSRDDAGVSTTTRWRGASRSPGEWPAPTRPTRTWRPCSSPVTMGALVHDTFDLAERLVPAADLEPLRTAYGLRRVR